MTSIIPPEWTFKFMGSPEAISFLRSTAFIPRLESSGKLQILELPDNYSLSSRETISQMFTDPHLYADILSPAEHLLVFQPDSIFCANSPKTLNDFLEWDWIGAPWSPTATHGGNGGLSLRKVSRILKVLEHQRRQENDGALEDLWLTERLHYLEGSHMPNATISKTFSVESVWDDAPLGYHVGWLGVHHEQVGLPRLFSLIGSSSWHAWRTYGARQARNIKCLINANYNRRSGMTRIRFLIS